MISARSLLRLAPRSVVRRVRAVIGREVAVANRSSGGSPVSVEQVLSRPDLAAAAVVSDPGARDMAFPAFAPTGEGVKDGPLPLPPPARWTVEVGFEESGRRDAGRMAEIVEAAGLELGEGTRVLDFGCGPARVLRWLPRQIDGWGVDVNAESIAWCQQALSPPFRFAVTGMHPHLPFEDRSFDLIYAGSVFTHLSELADTWLLELLRVVRPGGLLYLTVHDQDTVAFCRGKDPDCPSRALSGVGFDDDGETHFARWGDQLGVGLDGFTINRGYYSQVFYDRSALVRHWERYAEVVDVVPHAFALHQTAVVLRRQPDGATWR